MAGGSTQQSFTKALGAIKDSTKVNSEDKDLDIAVVKATNHVECPPKEKHVRKMRGSGDRDWELALPTTLVLVGRSGNGKSATGNSILGGPKFISKGSCGGVTSTCELQSTTLPNGRCVRVVDTPGLCDPRMPSSLLVKEIMKCLYLAKDGVHALLLVSSARTRFTEEEIAAVESLQTIFGDKVVDYMIVMFTGGDDLEEEESTLDDYLQNGAPDFLMQFIKTCGNRKVLFDNKSKDKVKKEEQLSVLLTMIDDMVAANGGSPYSNDLIKEAQELAIRKKGHDQLRPAGGLHSPELQAIKDSLELAYLQLPEQLKVMVEEKLRLSAERLEDCLNYDLDLFLMLTFLIRRKGTCAIFPPFLLSVSLDF